LPRTKGKVTLDEGERNWEYHVTGKTGEPVVGAIEACRLKGGKRGVIEQSMSWKARGKKRKTGMARKCT